MSQFKTYQTNSIRDKFFIDDNNDDSTYKFGNRNSSGASGFGRSSQDEEELKQIQEKIGHIENQSLQSTTNALRTLNETYEIGVKTGEVNLFAFSG
jgi:hypothetical protein